MVPIWEKYMLTVDEAVQYFGIGEKKIRMLISENTDTDYCFTVQVGNKSQKDNPAWLWQVRYAASFRLWQKPRQQIPYDLLPKTAVFQFR